jgi:DNA-binding NarL/FixJ family response regulator
VIRLLLVEDEPLVCQGLRMWLGQAREVMVVGEAHSDVEALQLASQLAPDVVLLDLSWPPTQGVATTTALRAAVPQAAVVFLSLHDDAPRRAEARAAGAYAFVGKQEGLPALMTAIHQAGGENTGVGLPTPHTMP